jgi:tripartite-type tricarboxylate transporter receptor subunit TctC
MNRLPLLRIFTAALALAAASAHAAWPDKPLKILLPFPAGGASDATARALGQTLARRLGQPVLVENRPGANGAVAAQAAMAAAPDGYTMLWASASMVALPYLLRKPPYGAITEMAPVTAVGQLPFCLFVHPSVPGTTLAEFSTQARLQPDKFNIATGSVSELMVGTKLNSASGARMEIVPYKGGAQLMPDLVAGRVQVNIGPCSTGMQFVKSGKLRVLATLLPARSGLLPDVPTAAEAGMPELTAPTWQALLAPPGTPAAITERLAREVEAALQDADTRAQFERLGVLPEFTGPAALEARIRQEAPAWERFVRDNAIQAE